MKKLTHRTLLPATLFILNCQLKTPGDILDVYPAEIKSFSIDGQTGIISGDTVTVYVQTGTTNLVATFKTTASEVKIGNTVQTNGVTANDFSQPKTYSLISFKGPARNYEIRVIQVGFSSFGMYGVNGTIGTDTISVNGRWWGLTNLVANFSSTGNSVTVNGVTQVSGVTTNNYTSPKSYVITAPNGTIKTITVSVSSTYPFADSGQTQCSGGPSGDGIMGACPQTISGQDGDHVNKPAARSLTGPIAHVTYTADYTTSDNVTGLVWRSCSQGQSGPACATGSALSYSRNNLGVDEASDQCSALNAANAGEGYAALKTWRLPTIQELSTLLNSGNSAPTIDTANFPTTSAQPYWTQMPVFGSSTLGWIVDFFNGYPGSLALTSSGRVRCVAGGAPGYIPVRADNNDGTITDKSTNLVWTKCSMDNSGTGVLQTHASGCTNLASGTRTWLQALADCNSLTLAGRSWRLPSIRELQGITDTSVSSPAIDTILFPATFIGTYWSSTTSISGVTNAWPFSFVAGANALPSLKTTALRVRCVSN